VALVNFRVEQSLRLGYDEDGRFWGRGALSEFSRILGFAKGITLFSGVLTVLCAAALFGEQLASRVKTGVWDARRLSAVLERLSTPQNDTYVTASLPKPTVLQIVADWAFAVPTVALLLFVAVLHYALYLYLVSIDTR
jgi:hypothetical protein